jgi:hypothetical protein
MIPGKLLVRVGFFELRLVRADIAFEFVTAEDPVGQATEPCGVLVLMIA